MSDATFYRAIAIKFYSSNFVKNITNFKTYVQQLAVLQTCDHDEYEKFISEHQAGFFFFLKQSKMKKKINDARKCRILKML